MTNKEHFKEEILEIACNGDRVAVNRDGKPCACNHTFACKNCILIGNCKKNFEKWCNSEYVEPCPFEKDELVEVSDDGTDWNLRYFSHIGSDSESKYCAFINGKKSSECTKTNSWEYCQKYGTLGGLVKEEMK